VWKSERIDEAKGILLRYYTDQQTSQSARLIGFVVALFTLLGAVQISKSNPLSTAFNNFPFLFDKEIASAINWSILKFPLFFASVCILNFFIVRAIYRFSVYGFLSSCLIDLRLSEIHDTLAAYKESEDNQRLIWALHVTACTKIKKDIKRAFGLPVTLFIPLGDEGEEGKGDEEGKAEERGKSEEWKGYLAILGISIFLTITILGLLW